MQSGVRKHRIKFLFEGKLVAFDFLHIETARPCRVQKIVAQIDAKNVGAPPP